MNRFLAIILLASLAFAHLPSTPASLRKSAAHKKRFGDPYLPSAAALRRGLLDVDIKLGDDVSILSQSTNGGISATINGATTTFLADPAEASPSSGTPSSPESSAPTPPPSGSSSGTSSTPDPLTSPSQSSPSPSETPQSQPSPPPPETPQPQSSPSPSNTPTPAPSTSSQDCGFLGLACIISSTRSTSPTDGLPPSSPIPTQSPSLSSNSDPIQPQPSSTPDDRCPFGAPCFSPSNPPVSSSSVPTQPPWPSSDSVTPWPRPSSTPDDSCLVSSIGCLPSGSPASTQPLGSLPSNGYTSVPSATPITFPTSTSGLPSSSTPDSLISSTPTSAPVPTNTQLGWVTPSLIFSSFSESTSRRTSLTDPDQLPTSTSFLTAGTPSVAPSVAPLPSGMPARIVPGGGGINPAVCQVNNLTLIAILFKPELNWDFVTHNPDSPGQICLWLPVIIATAVNDTNNQTRSSAVQVWIPDSYKGPSDTPLLQTTWLGCTPTHFVGDLAAQIKAKASRFYNGPYKDLASLVDPSFDITTLTATTEIPGSGGSNNSSPDGSRTRENIIIAVVCALGGITLIIIGYLTFRAVQKRRELAHRRLSDPPNTFTGEAPLNRNFDQDSIGGQRRRSFYFAEDSLRGFSDHNYTNDSASLTPEQTSGLNRRQIAGNIGPPVMRENSLNF